MVFLGSHLAHDFNHTWVTRSGCVLEIGDCGMGLGTAHSRLPDLGFKQLDFMINLITSTALGNSEDRFHSLGRGTESSSETCLGHPEGRRPKQGLTVAWSAGHPSDQVHPCPCT